MFLINIRSHLSFNKSTLKKEQQEKNKTKKKKLSGFHKKNIKNKFAKQNCKKKLDKHFSHTRPVNCWYCWETPGF